MAQAPRARAATITRTTRETDITASWDLDRSAATEVATGIGFFDHMLDALGKHSGTALTVRAKGDLHIDGHHTSEDVGIALGQCLRDALGDRAGIERFGHAWPARSTRPWSPPRATVDISGRPYLAYDLSMPSARLGEWDTELVTEFFGGLVDNARICVHLHQRCGCTSSHHIVEAGSQGLRARPAPGGARHRDRRAQHKAHAGLSDSGLALDGGGIADRERMLELGEDRFWSWRGGSGAPLVMLHGGPGGWDEFDAIAPMLAPHAALLRFDQRGCGRTRARAVFTMEAALADIERLRVATHVDAWTVLGHSFGCDLAMCYALAHPKRVRALILLASYNLFGDEAPRLPCRTRPTPRPGPPSATWASRGAWAGTRDQAQALLAELHGLQARIDLHPGSPSALLPRYRFADQSRRQRRAQQRGADASAGSTRVRGDQRPAAAGAGHPGSGRRAAWLRRAGLGARPREPPWRPGGGRRTLDVARAAGGDCGAAHRVPLAPRARGDRAREP